MELNMPCLQAELWRWGMLLLSWWARSSALVRDIWEHWNSCGMCPNSHCQTHPAQGVRASFLNHFCLLQSRGLPCPALICGCCAVGTHIPYQPRSQCWCQAGSAPVGMGDNGALEKLVQSQCAQTAAQWIREGWASKAVPVQSCWVRKTPAHSVPAPCSEITNLSLTTTTAAPFSLNRHRLTFSPQAVQEQWKWKDIDKILFKIQNSCSWHFYSTFYPRMCAAQLRSRVQTPQFTAAAIGVNHRWHPSC